MDFELSSEFSRIQAIPHFTIFAKKSESTRLWFQETLGTKTVDGWEFFLYGRAHNLKVGPIT